MFPAASSMLEPGQWLCARHRCMWADGLDAFGSCSEFEVVMGETPLSPDDFEELMPSRGSRSSMNAPWAKHRSLWCFGARCLRHAVDLMNIKEPFLWIVKCDEVWDSVGVQGLIYVWCMMMYSMMMHDEWWCMMYWMCFGTQRHPLVRWYTTCYPMFICDCFPHSVSQAADTWKVAFIALVARGSFAWSGLHGHITRHRGAPVCRAGLSLPLFFTLYDLKPFNTSPILTPYCTLTWMHIVFIFIWYVYLCSSCYFYIYFFICIDSDSKCNQTCI